VEVANEFSRTTTNKKEQKPMKTQNKAIKMRPALPWKEKVPLFSINPGAATQADIARLASELMEVRCVLNHVVSIYGDKFTPTTLDCARRALVSN
jgi:hypothetical protein